MKAKELSLVDLRFRGDRLVALTEGKYDPRTKRVEYRNVDLCNPAAACNVNGGRVAGQSASRKKTQRIRTG
jgi:hypothetical protein